MFLGFCCFFFSSRRRHTRCALVTGVQTCALPISALLRAGNLGLCPTDAGYALVWRMEARQAEENAVRLRALDMKHPFTVFCISLTAASQIGRASCRERVCKYV